MQYYVVGIYGTASWRWFLTSWVPECWDAVRAATDVGDCWTALSRQSDVSHTAAGAVCRQWS